MKRQRDNKEEINIKIYEKGRGNEIGVKEWDDMKRKKEKENVSRGNRKLGKINKTDYKGEE